MAAQKLAIVFEHAAMDAFKHPASFRSDRPHRIGNIYAVFQNPLGIRGAARRVYADGETQYGQARIARGDYFHPGNVTEIAQQRVQHHVAFLRERSRQRLVKQPAAGNMLVYENTHYYSRFTAEDAEDTE